MAPSPTGYFHVGSVRTTLYNWLYARQQGGTFVLRIEDTDAQRDREEWVDMIYDALRWLGLEWDELYRQSERGELYAAAAAKLGADGRTYWCDCTRDAVDGRAKARPARVRRLLPRPGARAGGGAGPAVPHPRRGHDPRARRGPG
jgi:glutamyl-tRNA synthetase